MSTGSPTRKLRFFVFVLIIVQFTKLIHNKNTNKFWVGNWKHHACGQKFRTIFITIDDKEKYNGISQSNFAEPAKNHNNNQQIMLTI